ncbi:MAG: SsrA-binding protein [Spirochaetes bacterium DG_61]|jgi:SsrA-binding protein|nr:MAG: SsrA-binding protein [Spirochaetes bacterium DG_61]
MAEKKNEIKKIVVNRKAFHDFTIIDRIEAGVALKGTEVKSIKNGRVSLNEGFCFIQGGEIYLKNVHVDQYPFGNRVNHDPMREKKLLLHKNEIRKLHSKVKEKGYTLVPLQVYEKKGIIKFEIGLARGKRLYDKKEEIRKRDEARDLKRSFKAANLSGKLR